MADNEIDVQETSIEEPEDAPKRRDMDDAETPKHEHAVHHKTHESPKHHARHETKHQAHEPKEFSFDGILTAVVLIMMMVIAFNMFQLWTLDSKLADKEAPAQLELVVIKDSTCKECFDISSTVSYIASSGAVIKSNRTLDLAYPADASEIKSLIAQFGILKLPTAIVTGEINKSGLTRLADAGGALVFRTLVPPYTNASTLNVEGRVSYTYLDAADCPQCTQSVNQLLATLKSSGLKFGQNSTINYNSPAGRALVEKYNITKVPTVILSSDAKVYDIIVKSWSTVGTVEKDGSYVTREITPVYVEVSTGKQRGFVQVTYINDSSCPECYDVTQHRIILEQSFGMAIINETVLDVKSPAAQKLISKYKITQVPMVLISPEASAYTDLTPVWLTVGSVETDGTYVFRNISLMSGPPVYKDLATGKLVNAKNTTAGVV